MFAPRHTIALGAILLPLALAACGGHKTVTAVSEPIYPDSTVAPASSDAGMALNPNADHGNKSTEDGATLAVNAYLWRGALDTLSFMPLASTDPYGGVIVTDWYSPPTTTGERFKATAFILGRQLRADGVRLQIFRQVRDGAGWADAPVNPATAVDIENKVLARARELRSAAAQGK